MTLLVDVPSLSYLVRWLHVAAMAGLFGGALLIVALSLQSSGQGGEDRHSVLLTVAQTYEWLFWLAIGLLVMTGVGNLGAFGSDVPEPETTWGGKLVIKLAAVGAFALLSLIRTLLVIILGAATGGETRGQRTILRWAYTSSLVMAAVIVAIAVSLAHG